MSQFLLLGAAVWISWSTMAFSVGEGPSTKKSPTKKSNTSSKARPGKPLIQAMGADIRAFGEEVANRIDRIVKKKSFDLWGDPWTMQGIPIVFPSPANGFNLGFRIQLQNIRRQDPHQFEIAGQLLGSDRGRYKHQFLIDAPRAFGGSARFTARVHYDRDISFRYFGIGNETPIDPVAFNQTDSLYYQNQRAAPSINLQLLRYFGKYWRIGPILGFKWTRVTFPPGGLVDLERPPGTEGGRSHFAGLAIIYDTLDFEPYPSRGGYHELFLYWHAPWIGSDYRYSRATYTYRRYFPLHRRLILAQRFMFERLWGNIPFYELGAVGGSNPSLGIGGDRYIRGFEANRFIDKTRFFFGQEFRWDPLFFDFSRQDLTIGFVPFFDIGRVWGEGLPVEVGTWHASTGWGMRLIWNSRLVLRGDLALTKEGLGFAVELGNAF